MADRPSKKRVDARDLEAELDERRVAKVLAVGLPLVTLTATVVTGLALGPAQAILVLVAGMLLGVISLFWASLRVLGGDAPLPPELAALDARGHGADALVTRKTMLLRSLKDLENERALGKLEEDDYQQLSVTYRGELKEVLRHIEASLAPYLGKAEDAVKAHLEKAERARRGDDDDDASDEAAEERESPREREEPEPATKSGDDTSKGGDATMRVACPSCGTSNDTDASFCKKCGKTCGAALSSSEDDANGGEKGARTADET